MTGKKTLGEELDCLAIENSILKCKNKELAKGLADKTTQCNYLLKSSEKLQSTLISTELQVSMFKEGFKRITGSASIISVQLAKIGQEIEHMLEQGGLNKNVVHSPLPNNPCNKTRAVKPMVSGHTISRPTVKLARVSTEQLQQMNGGTVASEELIQHIQNEIQENLVYPRVGNEEDDSMETEEESLEDNNRLENSDRSRLETVHEEDEAEQTVSNGSNQSALISGVFKDVRVYITPITSPINSLTPNSRKRKSTSSQTHFHSADVSNSQRNTSTVASFNGGNLSTTLIYSPKNSNMKMTTESTNTSVEESPTHNISTIPQINESLYQEELNETKRPEMTENTKSYDPLEGPSTLLDATNNQDLTMSMFRLLSTATDNKTSTPYTTTAVYEGKHVSDANKENTSIIVQENHVTQRRNNMLTGAKRPRNLGLESFRDCCVVINKLSLSRLLEHQSGSPNEQAHRNTNVRDNTSSTNSVVSEEGRPRRASKPVKSLKEPSLNRKMRR